MTSTCITDKQILDASECAAPCVDIRGICFTPGYWHTPNGKLPTVDHTLLKFKLLGQAASTNWSATQADASRKGPRWLKRQGSNDGDPQISIVDFVKVSKKGSVVYTEGGKKENF